MHSNTGQKPENQSNHFINNVRDRLLRGGRMSKIAGVVVSYAPYFGGTGVSRVGASFSSAGAQGRKVAAALLVAGPLSLLGASGAYAACMEPVTPGLFVCDGETPLSMINTINRPHSVTITGSISAIESKEKTGLYSLNSSATTSFTVTTDSGSTITGKDHGIYVKHLGTGALSITPKDAVTGTTMDGIRALVTTGSGLTIEAVKVTGGLNGIQATHSGTGDLSITTTGDVTGTRKAGIQAKHLGADNLKIKSTGDVTGGTDGINATHSGTGKLEIESTGDVTGTSMLANGIKATGYVTATGLTIKAAKVTGGSNGVGINAVHSGTGDLSITATGDVTGIVATGSANVANLTINAKKVAGFFGISTSHNGTGALSITATDVAGTIGHGIKATGYATVTGLTITAAKVTGGTDGVGINAEHLGKGNLSITATGDVTGVFGISAAHSGTTGALSITAEDDVTGIFGHGIAAVGFGTGLSITAAKVTGGTTYGSGITALHLGSGALSITATGDVTGTTDDGIKATGAATVTGLTIAAVKVTGGSSGINAAHEGTGVLSITATGDVLGATDDGIKATGDASVTGLTIVTGQTIKAVKVTGGVYGINASHLGTGALSITTTGDVTGTSGSGIYAYGMNDLIIITTGNVTGGAGAGIATKGQSGSTTSITLNKGTVSATSGKAITDTASNATVTVNSGAAVTGAIELGGGDDSLIFASGSDFSAVTKFDGGEGTDILRFTDTTSVDVSTVVTISNVEDLDVSSRGTLNVATGGRLNLSSTAITIGVSSTDTTITGSVINNGIVSLQDGGVGSNATITGNFGGSGSILMDVALGGDTSETDKLVIMGNASGSTTVQINNIGGTGAETTAGIEVIQVVGTSEGTFTLGGINALVDGMPFIKAGDYIYQLEHQAKKVVLKSESLKSDSFKDKVVIADAKVPTLGALPSVLLSVNPLKGFQVRTATRQSGIFGQAQTIRASSSGHTGNGTTAASSIWFEISGSKGSVTPVSSNTYTKSVDTSSYGLSFGRDVILAERETGVLVSGITGFYDETSSTLVGPLGFTGGIDTSSLGLNLSATWIDNSQGYFIDSQIQYTRNSSDIVDIGNANVIKSDLKSNGISASVEFGRSIVVSPTLTLIPQAQLALSNLSVASFMDASGTQVSSPGGSSIKSRIGVSAQRSFSARVKTGTVFGIFNFSNESNSVSQVSYGTQKLSYEVERSTVEFGLGGNLLLDGNQTIGGLINYTTDIENFGGNHTLEAALNLHVKF